MSSEVTVDRLQVHADDHLLGGPLGMVLVAGLLRLHAYRLFFRAPLGEDAESSA